MLTLIKREVGIPVLISDKTGLKMKKNIRDRHIK